MRNNQAPIGRLDSETSNYLRSAIARFDARARGESRTDANETAFLPRELLAVDPVNYQEMFAGIMGRRLFPQVAGIGEHAMSHSYKMWTLHGKAKKGAANGVTPTFGATLKEKLANIVSLKGKYEWTVDDIMAAKAVGTPLDEMTVLSAHAGLERGVDTMIAFGDADADITGALNNTDIDSTTVITGSWATATPAQILADIFKMVSETLEALNQAANMGGMDAPAFQKFTLLIPVKQDLILKKPRSDFSDTSLKQWLLQNLDNIEAIEPWHHLKGAGTGPSDLSLLYPRNPLALGYVVNQEFTSLAPQPVEHSIRVPCSMKCGGMLFRYPVACRYMHGI